jgi:mannitol PTS system EIICBA or EIICB component
MRVAGVPQAPASERFSREGETMSMAVPAPTYTSGRGWRAQVQRLGGFLAGMVIPNIGAFIAWGLITAFFIPTGWTPNEKLAGLVGPMIFFLLPILIGYTGGRLVHGQRGAVVGAIATAGVAIGGFVGTTINGELVTTPMFLGAMIAGPLGGWLIKQWDGAVEGRIPTGFEMLVGNFSAGIIGALLAILGFLAIGPVVAVISTAAGHAVNFLVDHTLLPLASIIVEPAKVLFLNNAINHGVLAPLGVAEAADKGKSILFMIETNPGPGLGLLLAYWFFGPRAVRPTAPGAIIIHFFGGIHEIYFPYVLMRPILILGMIAGGMAGVFTFLVTGAGLVATPSPGSIFAYLAVTPKGGLFPVLAGVAVAAGVSFAVNSLLLKVTVHEEDEVVVPETQPSAADTAPATA